MISRCASLALTRQRTKKRSSKIRVASVVQMPRMVPVVLSAHGGVSEFGAEIETLSRIKKKNQKNFDVEEE
jgi:hypothetical protein